LKYVQTHPAWLPCRQTQAAPANALVAIPAAEFRLGRERSAPQIYGWDNEFGCHEASTAAFEASRYLVSNQEFLAFVEAGGYAEDRFW
ncbi:SUMF1/EgtB/PvdO family nonheme iron enzyme, partial [Escherichia coli]|uniref:SUMF1/EgtB/PvdO family nonheme iron enzyme n=1 Tax=Escherichia coli TaxID=562 RepID=UPI0028E09682